MYLNDTPDWRRVVKIVLSTAEKYFLHLFYFHNMVSISFKVFQEVDGIICLLERIEQHFTANQLPNERQLSSLTRFHFSFLPWLLFYSFIYFISKNVYKILKNMVCPRLPKNKTYKKIEDTLSLRLEKWTSYFRKHNYFTT